MRLSFKSSQNKTYASRGESGGHPGFLWKFLGSGSIDCPLVEPANYPLKQRNDRNTQRK